MQHISSFGKRHPVCTTALALLFVELRKALSRLVLAAAESDAFTNILISWGAALQQAAPSYVAGSA